MADAIKKELNLETELIKSGGGVFEVEADGELVFSKKAAFRFPNDEEVIQSLKKMM